MFIIFVYLADVWLEITQCVPCSGELFDLGLHYWYWHYKYELFSFRSVLPSR